MLPPEVSPRTRYIMAAVTACLPLAWIPLMLGIDSYGLRQRAKLPTVVGEVVAFEERPSGRRRCGGHRPVVRYTLPDDPENPQQVRVCQFPYESEWWHHRHWIGRKVTVRYNPHHGAVHIAEWERPMPKLPIVLFSLGFSGFLFYMVARPPRKAPTAT